MTEGREATRPTSSPQGEEKDVKKTTKKAVYVKVLEGQGEGEYFVQVLDSTTRWGFLLCDEEQGFDGGFGLATDWEIVSARQVPAARRAQLGPLSDYKYAAAEREEERRTRREAEAVLRQNPPRACWLADCNDCAGVERERRRVGP